MFIELLITFFFVVFIAVALFGHVLLAQAFLSSRNSTSPAIRLFRDRAGA